MTEFAELCAKTNFSLLEGASHPEEMVQAAHALGLAAIGVADSRGLYGSVRAHVAARRAGIPYIVGAELDLAPTRGAEAEACSKLVLLARDKGGYQNLCRLLTRAHADLPREEARLTLDDLARSHEGLFLLLGPPTEEEVQRGDVALAHALRDIGGERAFLATSRRLSAGDRAREAWAKRASEASGLPLVATARPLFHRPSRKPLADVLQCIREKTSLDRAGSRLLSNAESYVRSASEMARIFRDAPERLALTVEIAKACSFSLGDLKYSFPCDDIASGETPEDALRRLVWAWAPRRYRDGVSEAVTLQLEKELELIGRMRVAQFFLSVYEIVKIARDKGILCQGRGSAANSAVCYVLGITAVDPTRSSLLFERFLSSERGEPPDIDVDFEHERREEVIQAIYAKYGRERAAMVSEVICYRGKSALREAAKAFGLSLEQADQLATLASPHDAVNGQAKRLREIGFDHRDQRVQHILAIAQDLQGFPRHMSTHVGGFVLSASPLDEVSPIEPAKIPGRTVVPWDKDDIDSLGFFKVDVLGLGMLTAIRKTLELTRASSGEKERDVFQAFAEIPAEEESVYRAISKADTIGVFQIESRAQMAMLPRMKPSKYYDLVIEVAIVRPGPIQGGMVHPYLRRRAGQEKIDLPHPALSSILDRTLGVPLFQEQVMQIAITVGGYSAGEADQLRRDMAAWKHSDKLLRHEAKLIHGFVQNGISEEYAKRLFSQIQGFGEYGFPESHAASFALLVYASAWLKVHQPLEFACALINSQPMGFYSVSSIVRDAQKHGVRVLPPDVARSEWDCTVEEGPSAASPSPDKALRLGLRLVKGIGEEVARRITARRGEAPFRDAKDVGARAELRVDQLDALAAAGALESLVPGRRQAMWKVRGPDNGRLFQSLPSNEREAALPPLPPAEQLRFDYATIGLSVDDHPMRHLRPRVKKKGAISSDELGLVPHGTVVKVAGLVLSRQRPATASGVVFVTLEDEAGMMNLIVTSTIFDRDYRQLVHSKLLMAFGKIERTPRHPKSGEHPVIHVMAEKIEALRWPGGLVSRSRDFH